MPRRARDSDARRGCMNRKLVALILSGVFPGLGQLYNREWGKGAGFVLAGLVLSWLTMRALPGDLDELMSAPLPTSVLGALVLLLAVWIWSLVDAWRRS